MSIKVLRIIWRLNYRKRLYLPRSITGIVSNTSVFQFQSRNATTLQSVNKTNCCSCIVNFSTKPALESKVRSYDELFNKLKLEQISSGNVNYDTLEKTIDALDASISENHSMFLIECCGYYLPTQTSEERVKVFDRLWKYLRNNNIISKEHYLAALNIFQVNNIQLADRHDFLEECKAKNSAQIYEQLIWVACSTGNIEQAKEFLDEMKIKEFPLTENVFNALILGHSRKNNVQGIRSVLEAMSAAGIDSSSLTYSELASAYIENGFVEKCEKILSEQGSTFNTKQLLKILKSAAACGLTPIVCQIVRLLPVELLNMKEIPPMIRNICTELVYSGSPEKAFLIIEAFPKPIFSENQDTNTFGVNFIGDMIKSNQPASIVIEFCKTLISSDKNTRALHVACEFAMRRNSKDYLDYLEAIGQIEKLRPHYFWPLLLRNFTDGGEAGVLNTLKTMHALGTSCDYETLSVYVIPRLSITLEDEKKAIKVFENCGIKTSEILAPLCSHLIFQQRVDQVISICELYKAKLDTEHLIHPMINLIVSTRLNKRYDQLVNLISVLDEKRSNPSQDFVGQVLTEIISNPKCKNDTKLLKKLITDLRNKNLKISAFASDTICYHLSRFQSDPAMLSCTKIVREMIKNDLSIPASANSDSIVTHPRNMNLDELEYHLIELETKELNTRGVLRRLLQRCVREDKLDRALEIKKKCDELKVQVSPGMLASVFDMYVKLKRLVDAEDYYNRIKKTFPGFLLDEHKIIDYTTLLIENNRYKDAKEILSKRANTTKLSGGDYINKNLWKLLTNCAKVSAAQHSNDNINRTKELFNLLQHHGYCRAENTLLGPIIREHLLRNNIKGAVIEFKEITEKYRKTPLQFEIMSQLIALSNEQETDKFQISSVEAKELLQEVITATKKIHGSVNTNNTLVMSVANTGTENQLRKLLINPEIRLNSETLIKTCEHLSNAGRIDIILKLAKAGRGMGHSVKEQDLYNILLNNFVKENNCSSALELFEKLEADDEFKISQSFLKSLVNLLKVNNIEIPTSVAIRTHNLL